MSSAPAAVPARRTCWWCTATSSMPAVIANSRIASLREASPPSPSTYAAIISTIQDRGYAGLLVFDPLNIRYATDTTNMSLWTMHNQVRYAFVSTAGPVIMFEFSDGEFLCAHSEVVDEIRPATSLHPFYTGNRIGEVSRRWAQEIVDLLLEHGGGGRRLAIDLLSLDGIRALETHGVDLVSGQAMLEDARLVKSEDEIRALRCAVDACERNIADMRALFEPGITEIKCQQLLDDADRQRAEREAHGLHREHRHQPDALELARDATVPNLRPRRVQARVHDERAQSLHRADFRGHSDRGCGCSRDPRRHREVGDAKPARTL